MRSGASVGAVEGRTDTEPWLHWCLPALFEREEQDRVCDELAARAVGCSTHRWVPWLGKHPGGLGLVGRPIRAAAATALASRPAVRRKIAAHAVSRRVEAKVELVRVAARVQSWRATRSRRAIDRYHGAPFERGLQASRRPVLPAAIHVQHERADSAGEGGNERREKDKGTQKGSV